MEEVVTTRLKTEIKALNLYEIGSILGRSIRQFKMSYFCIILVYVCMYVCINVFYFITYGRQLIGQT